MRPLLSILAPALALALTSAPALAQDPHAGHGAMAAAPANHAAHGVVTSPAEGEMTHGTPDWFTATFEHPMTLTAVTVAGEGKPALAVPVAAAAATTEVSADLPDLTPGRYVLTWTAKGADGHEMTGAVRFMVH
ncbi:MAG: methionine-rich copper-binding protein CopC [Pseudoalteromonas distincta]|jgi:methionine-rich copper-binding protein CopC